MTRPEDAGKPFSQLLRNPWGLLLAIKDWTQREARLGKSMGSDMETIFNSRIELSLYPKVKDEREKTSWALYLLEGEKTWVFPKIGVPQNGWFTMETPY